MFFSLGVGKIRAFIGVQCQAQATFIRANVIPQDIWILKAIETQSDRKSIKKPSLNR